MRIILGEKDAITGAYNEKEGFDKASRKEWVVRIMAVSIFLWQNGENMNQKGAYPIILKPTKEGYYVVIPDFDTGTQGETIADAMEMARDAIGLMGIDMEDDKRPVPEPYSVQFQLEKDDIVTLVDVDFYEYRKRVDNRSVKKNCTIPYWMSVEADKAGVNYSRVLQEALYDILGKKSPLKR